MNTKSEVSGPARLAVRPAGPPLVTGHGGPSSCTSGVRPPPLSLVMRAPIHRGLHPRDLGSPPAPPPDSTTWRIQQRPRGDSVLSTAPLHVSWTGRCPRDTATGKRPGLRFASVHARLQTEFLPFPGSPSVPEHGREASWVPPKKETKFSFCFLI